MLEDEENVRVSMGCAKLDRLLDGGPQLGDLGMIAAVPGVGKTNLLTHFALTGVMNYHRSLLLSLELTGAIIRRRAIAMLAGIEGEWLKHALRRWPDREVQRFQMVMSPGFELSSLLHVEGLVDKTYRPTILDTKITEWKRMVKREHGTDEDCRLVCVDWLDQLACLAQDTRLDQYTQKANMNHYLKKMATKHNVVIWTATQGNKEAVGKSIVRQDNVAGGFHKNDALDYYIGLGNSEEDQLNMEALDAAEETADGVYMRTDKHVVCTIDKNRHGSVGSVKLYQAPTLRFYDNQESYIRHMADLEKPNLSPTAMQQIVHGTVNTPKAGNVYVPGIPGM
jgi:replicative DNA helicase